MKLFAEFIDMVCVDSEEAEWCIFTESTGWGRGIEIARGGLKSWFLGYAGASNIQMPWNLNLEFSFNYGLLPLFGREYEVSQDQKPFRIPKLTWDLDFY